MKNLRLLTAVLWVSSCGILLAQQDPTEEKGLKSFGSYTGGDFDTVNLMNGNLILKIPLYSLPQRGDLGLSFSLSGNNNKWHLVDSCPGTGDTCTHIYQSYTPLAQTQYVLPPPGNETSPFLAAVWDQGLKVASHTGSICYSNPHSCTTSNLVGIYDPFGGVHELGFDNADWTHMRANDGSGYSFLTQNNTANVFQQPTSTREIVITPKGVRYDLGSNPQTTTDADGNQLALSLSSNSFTDSFGRTIPAPPTSSATSGSNPSCPTIKDDPYGNMAFQPVTGYSTWSPPGANNSTLPYLFCFTTVYGKQQFFEASHFDVSVNGNVQDYFEEPWGGAQVLQSVLLPNGTSWFFIYDAGDPNNQSSVSYRDILQIRTPLGGRVSYTYATTTVDLNGYTYNRFVTSRSVDAGGGPKVWRYTYVQPQDYSGYAVTVTDPDNNDTVTKFTAISPLGDVNWVETDRKTYQGSSTAGGSVLSETQTAFQSNSNPQGQTAGISYASTAILPSTVTTSNDAGQSITTQYVYDSGFSNVQPNCTSTTSCSSPSGTQMPFGNPISVAVSTNDGYYLKTMTMYQWQVDNGYYNADRLNLPSSISSVDRGNNVVSALSFLYDQSTLQASGVTTQLVTPAYPSNRGHITSKTATVLVAGAGSGSTSTQTSWYDTGLPYQQIDGFGRAATTYLYDVAYAGAFPTRATDLLGHSSTYGYDVNSGEITSHMDQNNNSSTFCYLNDGRLTKALLPDGGGRSWTYDDVAHSVTTAVLFNGSNGQNCGGTLNGGMAQTLSFFDGMGRLTQTQASAPGGPDIVDTTYDNRGRVYTVSNPHRATPAGTDGTTTFLYDALGRKKTETHNADNSSSSWNYSGNTVDFFDETGSHWKRSSDAMGRLTQVMELGTDASPFSLQTTYTYDLLNNLISVNQNGTGQETARTQRTFVYDSLSRLLSSTNPETGTICYGQWSGGTVGSGICHNGYDSNGNLVAKTDARGVTTSYYYDLLNRLTLKSASGISDVYRYDTEAAGSGATTSNGIGRLVWTTNSINFDRHLAYDAMGRQIHVQGCSPSDCLATSNPVSASYDLAGNLTQLTYPDGRSVVQNFDSAGRLGSVTSGTIASPGPVYLSSITYNSDGSPNVQTFGNNVQQTTTENGRLQVQGMVVASTSGGSPFSSHTYCYSGCATGGSVNNGNIWGITDTLNSAKTQGFTYDSLNRISSFSVGGAVNQQYSIDSFGNMSLLSGNTPLRTFDAATNRVNNLPCSTSTTPFDSAGNQLCDTDQYGGVRQYQYDAESRIKQIATLGSSTPFESYTYGADGARVRKTNADGTFTEYVTFGGQSLAEKDQNGKWIDYIYANGKKIAKVNPSMTLLHLHGVRDGSINMACGAEGPLYGGGGNIPVVTGDRLVLDFKQTLPSYGGFALIFDNGTLGAGDLTDIATGTRIWLNAETDQKWHHYTASLDAYANHTISYGYVGFHAPLPAGTFDMWMNNISILHADNTTSPIFNGGGPVWVPGFGGTQCGGHDLSAATETIQVDDPNENTNYYVGDHLGTTQMEFGGAGWPMWKGEFTPFGQELDTQTTAMHYKFTGKERDTESGLDYFGARYYGSNMGRFMSPDPFLNSGRPSNPQTWNRYTYGLNNPLRNTDPTGLYTCSGDKKQCSGVADALKAAQGALGNLKKGSADYKNLSAAISAYGKAGVDNGVHVGFGSTSGAGNTTVGVMADASGNKMTTADNPTGQNINVTIDPSKNGSLNQEAITLGHEGSHVADGTALVGALPSSLAGSDGVLGGPLNMTSYQTEMKAYGVSAAIGQGLGLSSLSVGDGNVIWNSSWGAVDMQTLRNQGIQHELADPKGLYNVTPDKQGPKLIQ